MHQFKQSSSSLTRRFLCGQTFTATKNLYYSELDVILEKWMSSTYSRNPLLRLQRMKTSLSQYGI